MLIQSMALNEKKAKVIQDWISEKQKETYYKVDPAFDSCEFFQESWNER
jgi:peptidyl-prolyl cis-trans isomerase SurA